MPKPEDKSFSDAIEKVMLENNYWASLKHIYQEIWNYKDKLALKGKTPEATIRKIVQKDPRFINISLATYALKKYRNKLPKNIIPNTEEEKKERTHTDIQGMLLYIGKHRNEVEYTYTDHRKKNFFLSNEKLGDIATEKKLPEFTYLNIVEEVKYIDVIWFNDRKFPSDAFEVEHTTDFNKAFQRFMELQYFTTKFCCVSEKRRESKFKRERDKHLFKPIQERVRFQTYEEVETLYEAEVLKNSI